MNHTQAMSPPPLPSAPRRRRESPWLWVMVVLVVLLLALPVLAVYGVASYFVPSSETRALRSELLKSSGVEWQQNVVVNVGGLSLGAVRVGLSFLDLEPEARAAIQTVRGFELGIYQALSGNPPRGAAMMTAADSAMTERGWYRVVGVMDDGKLVAVYAPDETLSARRMKCCVMVFDGDHMIVASARANAMPLIQCLMQRPEVRAKLQELSKL